MPFTPTVDEYSWGMGEIAGNVVELAEYIYPVKSIRYGPEIEFGKGFRLAPAGNIIREPAKPPYRNITGNIPHFHLKINNPPSIIRGGIKWHRLWDDLVYIFLQITQKR